MRKDWAEKQVSPQVRMAGNVYRECSVVYQAVAITMLRAERARARRIVRAVMKESTMSGFADLACRVILKRLG